LDHLKKIIEINAKNINILSTNKNNYDKLSQFILDTFEDRKIEPTSNNIISSRSHVVVILKLTHKDNTISNIIVCDLAGVENMFNCENPLEIFNFEKQYHKNKEEQQFYETHPISFDESIYSLLKGGTIELMTKDYNTYYGKCNILENKEATDFSQKLDGLIRFNHVGPTEWKESKFMIDKFIAKRNTDEEYINHIKECLKMINDGKEQYKKFNQKSIELFNKIKKEAIDKILTITSEDYCKDINDNIQKFIEHIKTLGIIPGDHTMNFTDISNFESAYNIIKDKIKKISKDIIDYNDQLKKIKPNIVTILNDNIEYFKINEKKELVKVELNEENKGILQNLYDSKKNQIINDFKSGILKSKFFKKTLDDTWIIIKNITDIIDELEKYQKELKEKFDKATLKKDRTTLNQILYIYFIYYFKQTYYYYNFQPFNAANKEYKYDSNDTGKKEASIYFESIQRYYTYLSFYNISSKGFYVRIKNNKQPQFVWFINDSKDNNYFDKILQYIKEFIELNYDKVFEDKDVEDEKILPIHPTSISLAAGNPGIPVTRIFNIDLQINKGIVHTNPLQKPKLINAQTVINKTLLIWLKKALESLKDFKNDTALINYLKEIKEYLQNDTIYCEFKLNNDYFFNFKVFRDTDSSIRLIIYDKLELNKENEWEKKDAEHIILKEPDQDLLIKLKNEPIITDLIELIKKIDKCFEYKRSEHTNATIIQQLQQIIDLSSDTLTIFQDQVYNPIKYKKEIKEFYNNLIKYYKESNFSEHILELQEIIRYQLPILFPDGDNLEGAHMSALDKAIYDYDMFLKIQYNCTIRRYEGLMINKSLSDLRRDIKKLSLKSTDSSALKPIYYDKHIFPYCRNINYHDDTMFDTNTEETTEYGTIIEKIKEILNKAVSVGGAVSVGSAAGSYEKINNLHFFIFTVVNMTDTFNVNNPPNPPYINLNELVYFTSMCKKTFKFNHNLNDTYYSYYTEQFPYYQFPKSRLCKKDESTEEIIKFPKCSYISLLVSLLKETYTKLNKYDYYSGNNNSTKFDLQNIFFDLICKQSGDAIDIGQKLIENSNSLIKLIQSVNPATLIGSIESAEFITNLTYDKVPCSFNSKLEEDLFKYFNSAFTTFQFRDFKLHTSPQYFMMLSTPNIKQMQYLFEANETKKEAFKDIPPITLISKVNNSKPIEIDDDKNDIDILNKELDKYFDDYDFGKLDGEILAKIGIKNEDLKKDDISKADKQKLKKDLKIATKDFRKSVNDNITKLKLKHKEFFDSLNNLEFKKKPITNKEKNFNRLLKDKIKELHDKINIELLFKKIKDSIIEDKLLKITELIKFFDDVITILKKDDFMSKLKATINTSTDLSNITLFQIDYNDTILDNFTPFLSDRINKLIKPIIA